MLKKLMMVVTYLSFASFKKVNSTKDVCQGIAGILRV